MQAVKWVVAKLQGDKTASFCGKMSGREVTGRYIGIPAFHGTLLPMDFWTPPRFRQNHPFTKPPFYLPVSLFGGSQKGGFQKGGFGGCSPGTKTGTRVRSPKPPFYETALLSPSELISFLGIIDAFLPYLEGWCVFQSCRKPSLSQNMSWLAMKSAENLWRRTSWFSNGF